jgi:Uma2 family endonuclease
MNIKSPFFGEAEPAGEIAQLFPAQGEWTEDDYLTLNTNRLVEFSHGRVEVLDMPSQLHQELVFILCELLRRFVRARNLGKVLMAPLPIQLWPGKFREPDIVFMFKAHHERRHEQYWLGADLVMEVTSPDDPKRDLIEKRREYAQAKIPEYWLIDPRQQTITILTLGEDGYDIHGVYGHGQQATSNLLSNFSVDVSALFAEAQE